jgi:RHS repeat-associated protein
MVQNAAGNMSKAPKPLDWGSAYTMTYDAWQRLVKVKSGSATISTYAYDGQNRRVTKVTGSTTRHYYYSSQWQILEERLNSTTTSDRQFVWGLMALDNLVLRDRGTERFYSLQDVFSCTAIVDTSGTVQERYGYNAFGLSRVMDADFNVVSSSSYDWETRYDNYRFDTESSFYQVRYRYLHPTLGRWLSRDPIEYDGGINLYAYCLNNGLNFSDPNGLKSKTFDIVGKSYIAHIGKSIGSVPGGNETALHLLAKLTDLAYSENPRTPAKDQHYRLYSEKSFCVTCDKSGNLSYKSSGLDMDAGKEGPFTGAISKVFNWEILISNTLQFSWKVHGRPNRAVEPSFTLVKKRKCWYIWHIISGTISCQKEEPIVSISIASSNFPSSRDWLNGHIKGGTTQGPFSDLWACSSSVPNEIQ